MLKYVLILFSVLPIVSCTSNKSRETDVVATQVSDKPDTTTTEAFFPVTTFLKGQINDIREKGINPMMYITKNNRVDSSWLKAEDLEKQMAPFLESVIDTANMAAYFSEKKFLDQTLNAYTFTYDPKNVLPDTLLLQHWDIYVDPTSNKVKRIYLIRKTTNKQQQQLTWQSDKWCKIVTIGSDKAGNNFVEQEVLIKWDF